MIDCTILLFSDNVSSMNEIHFEKFSKNGDKYLRAIKYKLHQNPQHVTLDYKNLISAGSTLGIFI